MIRKSMLMMMAACVCSAHVHAQFASTLQMAKKHHVVGEPIMVTLKVTNHSGQPQTFSNDGRIPWISFMLNTSSGSPVNTKKASDFGPMKIGPGQTLSRTIDLSRYFILEQAGNFSVSAVIRPPQSTLQGSATNRVFFEQRAGRIYWSQRVGNIGPEKRTHEFRLLRFRGDTTSLLYAQVEDDTTGQLIRTFSMGESLMVRKPMVTIDREQRMHAMFLTTPVMWLHYVIDAEGNLLSREVHKRAAMGDPKLVTLGNGNVIVTNSIPYDLKLAAKQRAEMRKITDRPSIPEGF